MSGTVSTTNPLSYTGIDPKKQPKFFIDQKAPTTNDFLSFEIGDQWLDQSSLPPTLYILVSVSNNIGLWKLIGTATSAGIDSINGISPGIGGDFGITAGSNVTISPGVNSISIASSGGGAGTVDLIPNSGTSPVVADGSGQITLVGSGSMTTVGGLNTLTVDLTGLTNHAVLVGAGTPTITKLAVGSNGQVLLGASTADPSFSTLTSADGSITFTTGPNTLDLVIDGGTTAGKTITGDTGGALPPTAGNWNILGGTGTSISGSGSTLTINSAASGLAWTTITVDQTAVVNNGYICNKASVLTLLLPSTAATGDIIRVVGKGSGGWLLAQNAGQIVHFGDVDTTLGVTGSIASTHIRDSIEILCTTANTDFTIISPGAPLLT